MAPAELGQAVRRAREAAGLSQRSLASAAGIDHSLLSRLEGGQIDQPRPDKLVAIADVLDVDLEDLYAAAGYTSPSGMPSLPAYLRTNYDLPLEAAERVEKYLARIKRDYDIDGGQA